MAQVNTQGRCWLMIKPVCNKFMLFPWPPLMPWKWSLVSLSLFGGIYSKLSCQHLRFCFFQFSSSSKPHNLHSHWITVDQNFKRKSFTFIDFNSLAWEINKWKKWLFQVTVRGKTGAEPHLKYYLTLRWTIILLFLTKIPILHLSLRILCFLISYILQTSLFALQRILSLH